MVRVLSEVLVLPALPPADTDFFESTDAGATGVGSVALTEPGSSAAAALWKSAAIDEDVEKFPEEIELRIVAWLLR